MRAIVFSSGILQIPSLNVLLHDYDMCAYSRVKHRPADVVLGWGLKPTAAKARAYAVRHQLPYVALEDGFLRSIGLGVENFPPYSIVVDDCGIYYDTTRSSRLEQLILQADHPENLLSQAERALSRIKQYRLSKYNHAPDFDQPLPNRPVVLVLDQTWGDMAVTCGQAEARHFEQMLHAAIAENPSAEIWVKTHPDVISGKKKGYLTPCANWAENVRFVAQDYNPLSLLAVAEKVYCVTSQMGFEAVMLGKTVVTFGVPWFAGWGLTDDRHPAVQTLQTAGRRKPRSLLALFASAYLQYSRYLNPNTGERGTIFEVIDYLYKMRLYGERLRGTLYCVGMSLWKRAVIKPFFAFPQCKVVFKSLRQLQKMAQHQSLAKEAKLLVWSNGNANVLAFAATQQLPVLRMEDGFIRSVGLGSNLVAPLSLVTDDLGIYFNAEMPSRLEWLLQHQTFSAQDLQSAEQLRQQLVASHIGKYNVGKSGFSLAKRAEKVILVPGQVEDDASLRTGSPVIQSNLALLKTVRANHPTAYILYKPHPDVESGNRVGAVPRSIALQYADDVVETANILDCIMHVDEVHTMTSLAGFEALLRGKRVHCYGLPFYSNWGLTQDQVQLPRRCRTLTLLELIAAVLIYYPLYVSPQTGRMIDAQTAIVFLQQQKLQMLHDGLNRTWLAKQWGKLTHLCRAFL